MSAETRPSLVEKVGGSLGRAFEVAGNLTLLLAGVIAANAPRLNEADGAEFPFEPKE
jgi:hypothetical protein